MAQIKSGASADLLGIGGNKAARVELFDANGNSIVLPENAKPSSAYGLPMFGANDGRFMPIRVDRFGSQASAMHLPLLTESFEGATLHSTRWLVTSSGLTATQSSGTGMVFNSGAALSSNAGYMIKSTRQFLKTQRAPLHGRDRARLNHYANGIMELGFGDASTVVGAHNTGAFWQKQAGGALVPVVVYNGNAITGDDFTSAVNNTNYYTFDVVLDDDAAIFFIQDTSTQQIVAQYTTQLPSTAQRLLSSTQISKMVRLYTAGSAPVQAPQIILTDSYVAMLDADYNAPASHIQAMQGRSALENPFTGAQLATFANSATPANATLANATAGYTTLGGFFSFAAVGGAATDYALFGFPVPTPGTLVVTGISIETWNTGAIVATTPTQLVWGFATQLTAVSLATAGHARGFLGCQSLPVNAAIGAKAERIDKTFTSPIICAPGRFFDIILRMPTASATASQVIQGGVFIEGYFI